MAQEAYRDEPPPIKVSEQIMLRMSPHLLIRVDAYTASLQVKNPGVSISRADAIRNLVELGLEVGMVGPREAIRGLIASMTYQRNIENAMAEVHMAPVEAGVSRTSSSIMNGYLLRAKELCPDNEAIQGLEPFDPDGWYGSFRVFQVALIGHLEASLTIPTQSGTP